MNATIKGWITRRTQMPEKFWNKVQRGEKDECWLWKGAVHHTGYGHFNGGGYRHTNAQRVAWELTHGPIQNGLFACHKCDNRRCVNPNHIFLGTHQDNIRDAVSKKRFPIKRGELHHLAKLTNKQAEEMRQKYIPWVFTQAMLAKEYGVSISTVDDVVSGRHY